MVKNLPQSFVLPPYNFLSQDREGVRMSEVGVPGCRLSVAPREDPNKPVSQATGKQIGESNGGHGWGIQ